jgi:hypothetical protein
MRRSVGLAHQRKNLSSSEPLPFRSADPFIAIMSFA